MSDDDPQKKLFLQQILGDEPAPTEPAVPQSNLSDEEDQHLHRILSQFNYVQGTVLDRFSDDRREIQELIDHLKGRVIGEQAPRSFWVEQLVSIVRAKSEQTAAAAKMLDSYSKLLGSIKGTNLVQNNVNVNETMLQEILDRSPEEAE